jgi:demethylmenaquinone methyltransferase/2-methoxy-6-polyprenyl-1,4-benzoquinol methylase
MTPDTQPGSGLMFDRIARRYDLLNRILSLGQDHRWRRAAIDALELPESARVLDLATGTADVAIAAARRHRDATVVGVDPSAQMLAVGEGKVRERRLGERVTLQTGDAQELALEDGAFDGVTMAFGIRNVPDRGKALREIRRVLKPGGRMAILELNQPHDGLFSSPARWWVRKAVPRIGAWLSGAGEYEYLHQSVMAFPPAGRFTRHIEEAGLVIVETRPMTFGAVTLFVAEKREGPEPA